MFPQGSACSEGSRGSGNKGRKAGVEEVKRKDPEKKRRAEEHFSVSRKDRLSEIGVYLVFSLILYLFFKSVFAFVLLPPGIFFYHRYNRKELKKKYRETLNSEFKDALLSISAALRAGYSMENALKESEAEMRSMYGEAAPISRELKIMKNQLALGIPMETIFDEFAKRSEVEDIETFASVFSIAKRTGGDLVEIIQKTSADIASKIDTKNEISVVIRSKRLEQNILILMPPLIILYVDLTAGTILQPLYQGLLGRIIMFVCLCIYIGAFFLSRKIMNIEV